MVDGIVEGVMLGEVKVGSSLGETEGNSNDGPLVGVWVGAVEGICVVGDWDGGVVGVSVVGEKDGWEVGKTEGEVEGSS